MSEQIKKTYPYGRRGFAGMAPERQREIASLGGRVAHLKNRAHEWTSEEARAAGHLGGVASRGGRGRNWKPGDPDLRRRKQAA
jgi:general stress protein YciG